MLAIKRTGEDTEYPVLLATPDMQERIDQFYERDRLTELHDYYDPVVDAMDQFGVPARLPTPEPKIGQLFWPVIGAARYAFGVFLLDSWTLGKLFATGDAQLEEDGVEEQEEESGELQSEDVPGNAVTLIYRDNVNEDPAETAREFPMYLLAARPLVKTGDKADTDEFAPAVDDAWVAILVDARYYWLENTGTDQEDFWVPSTWQDAFNALKAHLFDSPTITFTDGSVLAYQAPTDRWTGQRLTGLSIPHLMDAAAAYIGSRMLYTPDGGLELQRPTATNKAVLTDAHDAAVEDDRHTGGGLLDTNDLIPGIPSNALCIFYNPAAGGAASIIDTATGGGATGRHTIAWLDMTSEETEETKTDAAEQWAADYYEWQLPPLDALYVGALAVPQSAYLASVTIFHDATTLTTRWERAPIGWGAIYRGSSLSGTGDELVDPTPCEGHGWLTDDVALEQGASSSGSSKRVLHVRFLEGEGRCDCINAQGDDPEASPYPWVAFYDSGTGKWHLVNTFQTCCSCASLAITIPGHATFPPASATLTLDTACNGGATTYDMAYQCASENAILFAGAGPTLCTGTGTTECKNMFYMIAECGLCVMENVACDQCSELCAPPLVKATLTGFTGDKSSYNGTRYLRYTSACTWTLTCGDLTFTVTKTPTGTDDSTVITLTLSGAAGGGVQYTYEEPQIIVGMGANTTCFAAHTLSRDDSGGVVADAPATVGIDPEECTTCDDACASVDYASMVAAVSNATGDCDCVVFEWASSGPGNIATFGIPALSCPNNVVQLALRCEAGRVRVDVAGSAAQSVTLVSLSFDGIFIAVFDICFAGVGFDPCGGCFRITFTAPLL